MKRFNKTANFARKGVIRYLTEKASKGDVVADMALRHYKRPSTKKDWFNRGDYRDYDKVAEDEYKTLLGRDGSSSTKESRQYDNYRDLLNNNYFNNKSGDLKTRELRGKGLTNGQLIIKNKQRQLKLKKSRKSKIIQQKKQNYYQRQLKLKQGFSGNSTLLNSRTGKRGRSKLPDSYNTPNFQPTRTPSPYSPPINTPIENDNSMSSILPRSTTQQNKPKRNYKPYLMAGGIGLGGFGIGSTGGYLYGKSRKENKKR
jgi:hypothetical protein